MVTLASSLRANEVPATNASAGPPTLCGGSEAISSGDCRACSEAEIASTCFAGLAMTAEESPEASSQ